MKISSQEFQNNKLKTAVLFLVFNRPDTTRQVFEAIRQAKPPRLYVAADGPREGKLGEVERVQKARTIATAVDWPCKVKTLFRDKNLGCKEGVSSAITWFFENEEQGIILEDDCLPHLDFFSFCENLLDRYYSDERIFAITGTNFQNGKWRGDASYYFSKYVNVWGWATWRRAWKHYQGDINFWPKWRDSDAWKKYKSDKIERKYWQKIFDRCYSKQIDTWDYQWVVSTWYKNGLTATPNVNLVSNIGFRIDATHTKNIFSKFSKMVTKKIGILKYPKIIQENTKADHWVFNYHYKSKNFRFLYILTMFSYQKLRDIVYRLKSFLKKIYVNKID
jgi:hypothetical protein